MPLDPPHQSPLRWVPRLLFLLAALSPALAAADLVVLKNGREYKGTITSRTTDEVVIKSDGVEWTVQRSDIKSMKSDARTRDPSTRTSGRYYQGQVEIYRMSQCAECDAWAATMRKHHTPFTEFNVEMDRHAYVEFQQKCHRLMFTVASYPILDIDGRLMGKGTPGFPEKLAEILGHR